MPKNIILMSDGTGNSASKLFKTNVWRLYQSLDLSQPDPAEPEKQVQIGYYDDGVGTASFRLFALLGGAFGWGLKRNVLDLYTFLCRHYEEGDQIYCFGFSRGAFTIRMLTGVIGSEGLVWAETEGELRHLAEGAFRNFKVKSYRGKNLVHFFRPLRDGMVKMWNSMSGRVNYNEEYRKTHNRPASNITFLGLWDTVAAYGLPFDELTRAYDFVFPLSFPDRNISKKVDRACHVLALDDERNSFHPLLWNENQDDPGYKKDYQDNPQLRPLHERLTQVWFAGMHSNVGGGYPDDAMSNVTLHWIMGEAKRAGLVFKKGERSRVKAASDVNGKIYDSRTGLGGAYRYKPRKLKDLTNDLEVEANQVIIDRPIIHESVFTRIKNRIDGYAPIGLPSQYAVMLENGEIVDSAEFPAGNSWLLEHPNRARSRANRQEEVWNLVWWKRLFYFTSVGVFGLLVLLPLYRRATHAWEEPLSALSSVIGIAGAFLPGFLSTWVSAYQQHPGIFVLLALVFVALLSIGGRLQLRLFDRMGLIWKENMRNPGANEPIEPLPNDFLYKLRTNPYYQTFLRFTTKKAFPFFLLIVSIILIAQVASKGIFLIMDSFGAVCTPTSGQLKPGRLEGGIFRSNEICWASGVKLEEGNTYRIKISIEDDDYEKWMDSDIPSGVGGFRTEDVTPIKKRIGLSLGLLLRRNIAEPWFKPIARIGSRGSDEYSLNPAIRPASDGKTLYAEIKALRSGELFLFVNDAVLPLRNSNQRFYRNNHGTAVVNIEPLD